MPGPIEILASIIDWRFAVGLIVGVVLTLWYVVVGIYHPIIREQLEQMDTKEGQENGGTD